MSRSTQHNTLNNTLRIERFYVWIFYQHMFVTLIPIPGKCLHYIYMFIVQRTHIYFGRVKFCAFTRRTHVHECIMHRLMDRWVHVRERRASRRTWQIWNVAALRSLRVCSMSVRISRPSSVLFDLNECLFTAQCLKEQRYDLQSRHVFFWCSTLSTSAYISSNKITLLHTLRKFFGGYVLFYVECEIEFY